MNDYNMLDNRMLNALDFKAFVETFLKNNDPVEKLLRTPKTGLGIQPITEQDEQKFSAQLDKHINNYKQRAKAKHLPTEAYKRSENGTYFFPKLLENPESFKQSSEEDFVRIYIGLHSSNLMEFFKTLEDLLTNDDVSFYYKFFSVNNNSADRAVIYLKNDSIFKVLETIETIKETKPRLFKGAVNKYFTAPVCDGVGISGDLRYSFTETFTMIITRYFGKVMQEYKFVKDDKIIDDIIYNALLKSLDDPTIKKKDFYYDKLLDDKEYLIQQIRPMLYQKIEKFVNSPSNRISCSNRVKTKDGKPFPDYYINIISAFIATLPKSQQAEITKKLTDFKYFFAKMPEIISLLKSEGINYIKEPLSKKNVCYFESEYKKLQQLFEEYKTKKEEELNSYLPV